MRVFYSLLLFLALGANILSLTAGDADKSPIHVDKTCIEDPFARAIRPISNPTHFDLAVPRTQLHPLFITQSMPAAVSVPNGTVPLGGDFQLYALQFEYAFNERLSLNATKDGYLVFRPNQTLTDAEGFANVGAGLKYAWLLCPEKCLASNVQVLYEIPMGNSKVWQGEGDGTITPSVATLKLAGPWQLANQFGFKIPVDNNFESTLFYSSAHVSYCLSDWIRPLAEVNWFHVVDPGNGANRFPAQLGGALPGAAAFEGGDLINLGASNSNRNRDLITAAVGLRITPPCQPYNFGFAWETPLTDDRDTLMDNRFTLDMVWKF